MRLRSWLRLWRVLAQVAGVVKLLVEENKPLYWKEEDGTTYKISFSERLQEKNTNVLRFNNYLMLVLIAVLVIIAVLIALLVFNTGLVGNYLARAVCS